MRWLNAFDVGVRRRVFAGPGEPRYRLLGSCNGCGKCCETPSIQVERLAWGLVTVRRAFVWWQRAVNGMVLLSADPRLRLLIFRCTHYEPTTRRCDSYDSRPFFCRDYPVNTTFDPVPQLFDECSHRVVDRNADALLRALEAAGLPPDKLAAAKKKLYLE